MSTHQPLYAPASQETTAMPSQLHNHKGSAQWLLSSLAAGILGLAATPALAITTYDITLIGLYGAGYTNSSDGYQSNVTQFLSAAGQVAGYAERYNGATYNGQSTWFYNGSTTQAIGLTGTGHTNSSTGYQYNYAMDINAAGNVVGYAYRYNGATDAGYSAWLYNGSTTQEIGLTGTVYTRNDGTQKNVAQTINTAGLVAGQADRYNGATFNGKSAWLYNGSTTQEIGLTGTGYTRSDGYQANTINILNDAGLAAGIAYRYNGATATGYSAWLYNGSTTQAIGLTGTGHTNSSTGDQYNKAQYLNATGLVAGYAQRYNGATGIGLSAWLYNDGATQVIGLTDAGHTRSNDGYQSNFTTGLNAAGQVTGYASRYNGITDTGKSAWLYNGSTTQEIGLTGAGHTRSSDGYQQNHAKSLNAIGLVAGVAERYNGDTTIGYSAWFYNGSSTQQIGLTDSGHTDSSTGYQNNDISFLNAAGLVAGYAGRYSGASATGISAWLYDSLSNQTYSMDASVSVLTGTAYSSIRYLGDDGLALGNFTLYDAGGASLGNRAFSFTVADGWSDLGSLIDGGLNGAGWNYLATTVRANGTGYIIGNGVLTDMNGQAAYLLTPVPEPETWAMLLTGLGLVAAASRRRKGCADAQIHHTPTS